MLEELIQYQVFSPENNDFQKKSEKQFLYGIKHVCSLFNPRLSRLHSLTVFFSSYLVHLNL